LNHLYELTKDNLQAALHQVKLEIGSPFFSLQTDMWTTKNMAESYASLNVSFVERKKHLGEIVYTKKSALLACETFPHITHTAVLIHNWMIKVLSDWGFRPQDVVMLTVDDGASIVKAAKIGHRRAGWGFTICFDDQLQRCILYALGLAGKTSRNPRMKEIIAQARRMVATVNHSTQLQKLLKQSQEQRKLDVLMVKQDVITRWSSTFNFTERANILEPFLIAVMSDSTIHDQSKQLLAQVDDTEMQTMLAEELSDDDLVDKQLYVPDFAEEPVAVPSDALLTSPKWDALKAIEGFSKPVAQVVLQLEGQTYTTADIAWPQLLLLKNTYQLDTFNVPLRMDQNSSRQRRQWQRLPYAGQPTWLKDAKKIFLAELQERFFDAGPSDNALRCMFLNLQIKAGLDSLVGPALNAKALALVRESAQLRMPDKYVLRKSPRGSPNKRQRTEDG
jgi:hypothetical protein